MSDSKPTHWFQGVFDNGIPVSQKWAECVVDGTILEGCVDNAHIITIRFAEGAVMTIKKDRLLFYRIGPWKELPDEVRAQVELAKARPSTRDVH